MRLSWIIAISLLLAGQASGMNSFDEVKSGYQSSEAVLRDRHGGIIHEVRVDPQGRRLEWVKLGNISPALVRAVIRSEDKRFYDHHGTDWRALATAAIGHLFGSSKRGASTITMQLASSFEQGLKAKKRQRTIWQKWEQIKAAEEIEKAWGKDQILEAYLNLVSFRGELRGIAAASRGIFDKEPSGLDEAESAVLAALIRSPNAPPEKVGERAELLAESMGCTIPSGRISQLALASLSRPYHVRTRIDYAPQAARLLLHDGVRCVRTTLDIGIQRFAAEALRQSVSLLSDQNVRDGAALVVDNKTGDILAYIGNAGNSSSAAYVDGVQARRQAGSTLKPFLYGLAIEKKIISTASLIDDSPLDIPTERGIYRPENYDKDFRGFVPARTALASSLNIPAVRTLSLVGVNDFVAKLRKFGFSSLRDPDYYGPSLALGTADISLWELVNAYRALANGGIWGRMHMTPARRPYEGKHVLTPQSSFIISSILSDREARSATFSLESPLATRFWTAAKTGTSKDMRDNWCIGYSDRYTVGVWVGNFSGAPMWNVSGVSGAAPVWLEIMDYLHRESTSIMPAAPDGVVERSVKIDDGKSTVTKREFFIADTYQDMIRPGTADMNARIIYPADNMIIAIDPDIPTDLQKVYFRVSAHDSLLQLKLDETVLDVAPDMSWLPSPGAHHLYLISREGHVLDKISFEVR